MSATKRTKKPVKQEVIWRCGTCNWTGTLLEMKEDNGVKTCPTCNGNGQFNPVRSKQKDQQSFIFN